MRDIRGVSQMGRIMGVVRVRAHSARSTWSTLYRTLFLDSTGTVDSLDSTTSRLGIQYKVQVLS